MREDEDIKCGALLVALAEALNHPLSTASIKIYFSALKRFEFDDVERAISKAGQSLKWFPKPVELIELIEGSTENAAAQAWALFNQAVETGGYYQSLFVEDAAAAFAIRRTFPNWIDAVNMPTVTDSMHASLRKVFCAAYASWRLNPCDVDRYFVGYYEGQNRANVSTWDTVSDGQGEAIYHQKVLVIAGGKCFESRLAFSRLTGQLTETARQALLTGTAQPAQLTPGNLLPARMIEGEANPAEVTAQIRAMIGEQNKRRALAAATEQEASRLWLLSVIKPLASV